MVPGHKEDGRIMSSQESFMDVQGPYTELENGTTCFPPT